MGRARIVDLAPKQALALASLDRLWSAQGRSGFAFLRTGRRAAGDPGFRHAIASRALQSLLDSPRARNLRASSDRKWTAEDPELG